MKRGSKFLIVALSSIAMAGTAAAQGDDAGGGDAGGGDAGGGDAGGGDAGGGDAGGGDAGGGDAGGGDAGGGDAGGGDMGADAGGEGGHGLVLDKGKLAIFASVDLNLASDFIAKPFSIAPDIFYGVMPKLEVGLAHSGYNLTGFWGGGLGSGLCLAGEDNGCAKVYDNLGVIGRYMLVEGGVDLAADAGVLVNSFDPFMLALKVGVKGRKMAGKIMIGFNPNIFIGLTERDFNKEFLNVPVDVHFLASPKLAVGVQTGIYGPLDGFGDAFAVPVSIGAMFKATDAIMAGASFNLLRVAGFEGPGAADLRSLSIFVGWHN